MVISLYPGQAAEEVEKQVTIPVERALIGMPQRAGAAVDHVVRSLAGDRHLRGRRRHLLRAPASGRKAARRRSARRGHARRSAPTTRRSGRSTSTRWRAIATRPSELRSWQDWVVAKQLMRAPGVADVVSFGGFQKEYHVLADPARLRASGLTLEGSDRRRRRAPTARPRAATCATARASSSCAAAATCARRPTSRRPSSSAQNGHAGAGAQRGAGGRGRTRPRRGAVARGEAIDSVEGTILLRRGENPQATCSTACTRRSSASTATSCRKGMQHRALLRPHAAGRHDAAHGRRTTCSRARRWSRWCCGCSCARSRGSLAVAVTMPLALLTAFVGLHFAGVPANMLSMGAIDFGILLDGAVILVENAYRHLAEEQPAPDDVPARRGPRGQGGRAARRCSRCRSSSPR